MEEPVAVQTMRREEWRNPATLEEAQALVKHVESLFMPWNIDALVAGFTFDCVVRFGTLPEIRGQEALRTFFTARSARQKNYRLTKELKSYAGDTITNVWRGTWLDAESGIAMKGFGVEVWKMDGGRIAVWEAAFNVARADQEIELSDVLK
jgi:nuclear transport factor 2 (NTF2) superfamily protein